MAARNWNRRRFVTASLAGGAALAASAHIANESIAAGGARVRWNATAGTAEKA